MSQQTTEGEPDPRILAELSALADGTLEHGRAERLRELIAGSRELGARYHHERRAVLALQRLNADRAPASLRGALVTQRRPIPRRRGRSLYAVALASAAAAAAVILLVLLAPAGSPGAPALSQAAVLALRGPAMKAPGSDGRTLSAAVGELYFPDWGRFGWKPSGERVDRLNGRLAVTVYYRWDGRQIAYTILATPPLRRPGSPTLDLDGIALQRFVSQGRLVVTWRRAGHTCLLSGAGASTSELAQLAGYEVPRSS